jgi:hypothetical protein
VVAGEVCIELRTEKRLIVDDSPIGEFNKASILLSVSGSDVNWVEKVFNALVPFVQIAKLGGIYRPLWIFRNKLFISISSHVVAWMGFFIGMTVAGRLFAADPSRQTVLQRLLSETDLSEKINIFARHILDPQQLPWWQPLIVMSFAALTFAVIYFSAMFILPHLTPGSSIAIGLSSRRAHARLNTFRFLIFSVLILAVLVPLLLKLIGLS